MWFPVSLNDKLTQLAKRRGFYFQSTEAYGGVAGFQTFGPQGAELKRNLEQSWRETFTAGLGNREIEAPTVMPEPVFEASGHLDGFDDMIIKCPNCGESIRADHLVEDNTGIDEAESFSTEQIEALIEEHSLECPECGESLTGVAVDDFNLMFQTEIGPGSGNRGYLRPETAQGIFVEFPRLKQYARNSLPFGITQIGKAYRNEISPRKGLVRTREFTQAELEQFIDPEEDRPPLDDVKDVELKLYPVENQEEDRGYISLTVEEAVEEEVVLEWVGYFLGVAKEWYESIGVDMDRFRFRQHLEEERAHYASDCWDAESQVDGDWIEIAGFAYRGCYDLKKHAEHSGEERDYKIFKKFDEPKTEERQKIEIDMGQLGPRYGEKASEIADIIRKEVRAAPEVAEDGKLFIHVDGEEHAIDSSVVKVKVEEETVNGKEIVPAVIEPSFGVDRTVYTVLAHSLDIDVVDGEERTVMRLPEELAPFDVAVFPLMDKDGLSDKAREVASMLRDEGLSVKYDESGNIGRRYRRMDEVGTPKCVTVDYETVEEDPETVTVRDRDTTKQERVKVEELVEELKH